MSVKLDHDAVALELRTAERNRIGVPLLTERFEGLTAADARAIALAVDALRRADGDELIGYKLGWTSAAMREALGIGMPNWGTLWSSQRLAGHLDLATMIHPKVEPEFVFVAGADIQGPVDAATVIAGCAGWCVGMEIVDPRFPSFRFDWLDNTADNSSAAGTRTGTMFGSTDTDPATFELSFTDGSEERSGRGERALGSPVEAVRWLVERLAGEGERLRAGQIVYTGGVTAPFDLTAGRTYRVASPQLGNVELVAS